MAKRKQNQHYVWKYYLKRWATEEMIYCKRKEKVFQANISNIANENDFYSISSWSKKHYELVKALGIDDLHKGLKGPNNSFLELISCLLENDTTGSDIPRTLIEEYHTIIEGNAIKYLDALNQYDKSFYDRRESKIEFLIYICTQYFRTKKQKKVLETLTEEIGINYLNDVWQVLSLIIAINLAYGIYNRNHKLHLMRNNTNKNFITGDQPVVNTLASENENTETIALEFYYPISPKLAIMILRNKSLQNKMINSDEEVNRYNELVVKNSIEQLYAKTKEELSK